MSHDWPGNVRELRNVAERFALGLPAFKKSGAGGGNQGLAFAEAVEAFERNLLERCLAAQRRQPDPGQPGTGHGQDHAVRQSEKVRPEPLMDLILKAALGAAVVVILAALAETRNYYIAGAGAAVSDLGTDRPLHRRQGPFAGGSEDHHRVWHVVDHSVFYLSGDAVRRMVDRMRLEALAGRGGGGVVDRGDSAGLGMGSPARLTSPPCGSEHHRGIFSVACTGR